MNKILSLIFALLLGMGVASASNYGWHNSGSDIVSYNDCQTTHTAVGDYTYSPCFKANTFAKPYSSKTSIYQGGIVENKGFKHVQVIPVTVRSNMDTFKTDDNVDCTLCNDNVHQESKPYNSGNGFDAGNSQIYLEPECFVHVTLN